MTDKVESVIKFSAAEQEIFAVARAAGEHLRRTSFDQWCAIGRAVEVAHRHADAGGGSSKVRAVRFRAILTEQELAWLGDSNGRTEMGRLRRIMAKLKEVEKWRSTLSDHERVKWSSPQSIWNRAPIFRDGRPAKGPAVKAKPMSVSELMHKPADEIALLMFRRSAPKFFAVMRSMEELAASGTAVKAPSGWATTRERAHQVAPGL
jgi:hypothetical protein